MPLLSDHRRRPAVGRRVPVCAGDASSRCQAGERILKKTNWVWPKPNEPAGCKFKTFHAETLKQDVSYLIWLPPGCFTPAAVDACQVAGVPELHDVCPVGAWHALQILQKSQ